MNSRQRVQAVLDGQLPDHPPVSFWHHFPADRVCGPTAVAVHVDHLRAFDLDFLKVMDDNGYPHQGAVDATADLASIVELAGNEPEFQRQLDLLSDLRRQLGPQVPMITHDLQLLGRPAPSHPPAHPAQSTRDGCHRRCPQLSDSAVARTR